MPQARLPLALVGSAFFASGAAALVYQVAWQRILALHTGVGTFSIALIVAAFMAGLGLGSRLGGGWSARLRPSQALLVFAAIELAIAVFGAASIPLYYDVLYRRFGTLYANAGVAAALQLAALLPPTTLMGLSLPFLVRASVREAAQAGRVVGLLYAVNTLGAAVGALLAPWVLVRHLGLRGAVLVAVAANVLAATVVLPLALRRASATEREPSPAAPLAALPGVEPAGLRPLSLWLVLYAGSGFCALSLEIVWFRLLDVATRTTAFAFGTLLAVYLAGSAAGCLLGARRAPSLARPLHAFLLCQCLLLGYAGGSVLLLTLLPASTPGLAWLHEYWRSGVTFKLGTEWELPALVRLYIVLPLLLFGPATLLMGYSFPVLQRAVHDDAASAGRKVGLLQAANIAGCVAGSLAIGLLALSWLGTSASLRLLVSAGAAFAAIGVFVYGRRSVFPPFAAALLLLAAALPGNDRLWQRLHAAEGSHALIAEDASSVSAIVPQPTGFRVTVNGKLHSSIPFGGIHTRLGATPAMVHKAPEAIAIVGLGSGDTAWAAGSRPETRSITVFEIAGGQLDLLRRLASRNDVPDLQAFLADPRVRVQVADGRYALARGGARYDLIEADALWPYAAYSGNLYSVEFFRECAARLRPGGLMCTWAPTPRVGAAFRAAFAHVLTPRDRSFLIGGNQPIALEPEAWAARAARPEVSRYLGGVLASEIQRSVGRLVPFADPPSEVEPDIDLFPRDEFLSP